MTLSLRAVGLAIVAALLLPALPAHVERADRDRPPVLEADNASYDSLKQVYHSTGNVVPTKDTMVLRSDQADLCTNLEGYNHAVATFKPGNLAFIHQRRDSADEYIQGWGGRIECDGKQEISKLIARVRMERLQGTTQLDETRDAVITYDGQKEFYTALGSAENATAANPPGRVRVVLVPRTSAPAMPVSAPVAKP